MHGLLATALPQPLRDGPLLVAKEEGANDSHSLELSEDMVVSESIETVESQSLKASCLVTSFLKSSAENSTRGLPSWIVDGSLEEKVKAVIVIDLLYSYKVEEG